LHHRGSRNVLQIFVNVIESEHRARRNEALHILVLSVTELHHQPAARFQFRHSGIENAA
jgi:hypothetical protein